MKSADVIASKCSSGVILVHVCWHMFVVMVPTGWAGWWLVVATFVCCGGCLWCRLSAFALFLPLLLIGAALGA
jgi:hypothetical protein